jgi:hypothetical protein
MRAKCGDCFSAYSRNVMEFECQWHWLILDSFVRQVLQFGFLIFELPRLPLLCGAVVCSKMANFLVNCNFSKKNRRVSVRLDGNTNLFLRSGYPERVHSLQRCEPVLQPVRNRAVDTEQEGFVSYFPLQESGFGVARLIPFQ